MDQLKQKWQCEVHNFSVGDVEEPDLYAGMHMSDWQRTDRGKWVMDNAQEVSWHRIMCEYGYEYIISAEFKEKEYIYYKLKFE